MKEDRFVNVAVDDQGVPAADSAAIGYALPIPGLWHDHDDRPRPPRTPTAGAMELVPGPASQPGLQNQGK